jgi:hypothetical protein
MACSSSLTPRRWTSSVDALLQKPDQPADEDSLFSLRWSLATLKTLLVIALSCG